MDAKATPPSELLPQLVAVMLQIKPHLSGAGAAQRLNFLQVLAVLVLDDHQMSMQVLANRLSCDASHITGLVDGLEERGLVERASTQADRRVKRVQLTAHGRRFRRQVISEVSRRCPAISKLPVTHKRRLGDVLATMLTATQ